jgi:hypothetical protein
LDATAFVSILQKPIDGDLVEAVGGAISLRGDPQIR